MSVNDLKIDIITIVNNLSDAKVLNHIRAYLKDSTALAVDDVEEDSWKGAATSIRKGVSFEDLMEEQNYKPIDFEEFQQLVNQGEWETPLDELLTM